jgi:hypothetical protein
VELIRLAEVEDQLVLDPARSLERLRRTAKALPVSVSIEMIMLFSLAPAKE